MLDGDLKIDIVMILTSRDAVIYFGKSKYSMTDIADLIVSWMSIFADGTLVWRPQFLSPFARSPCRLFPASDLLSGDET